MQPRVTLYHISDKKQEFLELIPRIPDVACKDREDQTIKRISFSTDLGACVRHAAVHYDYINTKLYLYVYEVPIGGYFRPTKKQCDDAWATTEVWIFKPVKATYFGEVKIHGPLKNGWNYLTNINEYEDMSFTLL